MSHVLAYFLTCDCGAEIRVTALETQQYRAKTCDRCGAEIVLANSDLREARILVLFRCHNPQCSVFEQPQEHPITRSALEKMSHPNSTDKFMCVKCGQLFGLTDQEKDNNVKMLAEEFSQAS